MSQDNAGIKRYDTVLSFLALELLALACFGLGAQNGLSIFRVIGFFVTLPTLLFVRQNKGKEHLKLFFLEIIPFAVLALLLGVSRFHLGTAFWGVSLVLDLSVFLGSVSFFVPGYAVKSIPVLKRDYIVLAILGALALYVLITGLYSFARYGFFYAAIYKGQFYYYDGIVFPVWTETKILNGFLFEEASLQYGAFPAIALASSGVGCFFINPKNEKRRFFVLLGLASVGLLYLFLAPYWISLILVACVVAFFACLKFFRYFVKNGRIAEKRADFTAKILYFFLIGIVFIGVLILFIDAFTNSIFSNFPAAAIRASRASGKLYAIASAIRAPFTKTNMAEISSFDFVGVLFGVSYSESASSLSTQIGELNVLWQSGFIAFLLLAFFAFAMFPLSRRFLLSEEGPTGEKVVIVALLLITLIHFSLFDSEFPLSHGNGFFSSSRSGIAMMVAFLCGNVFEVIPLKKKEVAHEE